MKGKRTLQILLAAGLCCCLFLGRVQAAQGADLTEGQTEGETAVSESERLAEDAAVPESERQTEDAAASQSEGQTEDEGICSLQIPGNLELVINPWELSRKPQIYSEEYAIKNSGGAAVVFAFTDLACEPRGEAVEVQSDKEGLHEGGEKKLCLEMEFGNGDVLTLTEEPTRYEALLEPGEELVFWFSGEVNENAAEEWSGGELSVTVTYAWDPAEEASEEQPKTEDTVEADAASLETLEAEDALEETEAGEQGAAEAEEPAGESGQTEAGNLEQETAEEEPADETEQTENEESKGGEPDGQSGEQQKEQ